MVPRVLRHDVGAVQRQAAIEAHIARESVDVLPELDGRPSADAGTQLAHGHAGVGTHLEAGAHQLLHGPGVHQREDGVRGLATELQPEAAAPQVEEGGLAPVAGLRVAGEQDAGPVLDPDEEAALEQVRDDQDAIGVLDVDPHLFEVGVVEEALDDNPRLVDDQLLVVGPRGRGHQAPNRHSGSGEEKRAARPIDHA